jgi:hypothetical protein
MADLIKYINNHPLCDIEARDLINNIKTSYATQTYVAEAIAKAQLGGGDTEIDLSGYATEEYVNDRIQEFIIDPNKEAEEQRVSNEASRQQYESQRRLEEDGLQAG